MAAQAPVAVYDRETLVVRTRDFAGRWAHPHKELRRLAAAGVVRPLVHGYWLVPPADRVTDQAWRPEVEALARTHLPAFRLSEDVDLLVGPRPEWAALIESRLPKMLRRHFGTVTWDPRQRRPSPAWWPGFCRPCPDAHDGADTDRLYGHEDHGLGRASRPPRPRRPGCSG
ncbi:MAG: hypothetical protein ACRDV9_11625 [Acidimicrobiia bacterium]